MSTMLSEIVSHNNLFRMLSIYNSNRKHNNFDKLILLRIIYHINTDNNSLVYQIHGSVHGHSQYSECNVYCP